MSTEAGSFQKTVSRTAKKPIWIAGSEFWFGRKRLPSSGRPLLGLAPCIGGRVKAGGIPSESRVGNPYFVVRRQVKVDKGDKNEKRQFSKLFHTNPLCPLSLDDVQIGCASVVPARPE